jgi:phosphatidylglycerol:prolipoprotein diacylglycerol transferase
MFPTLFQIGSVKVVTLPFVLLLSLIFGVFLFWRRAKKEYFSDVEIFDLSLILVLGVVLGGKVFEFLLSVIRFGFIFAVFRFWNEFGAFSFFGAIAGGIVVAWIYSRYRNWAFFAILDFGVVAFSGSLVLVWFGSLLSGSAYGSMTSAFWGISSTYLLGKRQPTQVLGILIFLFIFLVLNRFARRIHFGGFLTSVFLMVSAVFLFFLEFLRGDSVYLLSVRVNQIFSVVLFIFGLLIFYIRAERSMAGDLRSILPFGFGYLRSGYLILKKIVFNLRISAKYRILFLKRRMNR